MISCMHCLCLFFMISSIHKETLNKRHLNWYILLISHPSFFKACVQDNPSGCHKSAYTAIWSKVGHQLFFCHKNGRECFLLTYYPIRRKLWYIKNNYGIKQQHFLKKSIYLQEKGRRKGIFQKHKIYLFFKNMAHIACREIQPTFNSEEQN